MENYKLIKKLTVTQLIEVFGIDEADALEIRNTSILQDSPDFCDGAFCDILKGLDFTCYAECVGPKCPFPDFFEVDCDNCKDKFLDSDFFINHPPIMEKLESIGFEGTEPE